ALIALAWQEPVRSEPADTPDLPPAATTRVDFARDIRPILAKSCYSCHGPEKQKSGLRLDRKADALAGGDSGALFEAGKSDESLLIEKVAALDPDSVMPPKGERLSSEQGGLRRAWIDQGGSWPDDADGSEARDRRSDHWAFQPLTRPEPPPVKDLGRIRNPIDAFALAKLEAMGVSPSPEADRATLIRRLSLDL